VLERLRADKSIAIACLVVALGVAFVARGVMAGVTGDDRAGLPVAIESVSPVPQATQAFAGTSVFVDLLPGYSGELTIDGVTIETVALDDLVSQSPSSGSQVSLPPVTIYEAGNATLTFTPSANAPIEAFSEGEHTVRLSYWLVVDGRQAARTYQWTFTVV